MKTKNTLLSYILILGSIAIVAGLGTLFVQLGMPWYNGLNKPSEFVPNWVVPTMWTIIYVMFAIILCIWVSKETLPMEIIGLLVFSGILNILWCLVFFTLHQLLWGVVIILAVALLAYWLVGSIAKRCKLYGYLLFVYPIWTSIAFCLNACLWILN